MQEHESTKAWTELNIEALCALFEGAVTQAKRLRKNISNQVFTTAELDWFSRNAYNLALRACATWPPSQTMRMIHVCIKFIELFPQDIDAQSAEDLRLRRAFCNFLGCSLLTAVARNEDHVERQVQNYADARKHAQEFRSYLQLRPERTSGPPDDDLEQKASTVLSFEFEAAVRLKVWEDLSDLVRVRSHLS